MRMHYSKDVDAIYIRLREDKIEDSDEVSDGVIMDSEQVSARFFCHCERSEAMTICLVAGFGTN